MYDDPMFRDTRFCDRLAPVMNCARPFRIDCASVDRLYREHHDDVVGYFARRLYDASDAADLASETFVVAYAGRRQFRGQSEEQAVAWLYGIARRRFLTHLRREGSKRRALARFHLHGRLWADDDLERVEELASIELPRSALRNALPMLSFDHQTALLLRVVRELDYGAIAAELGVSEAVARARVSRALRALAVRVDDLRRSGVVEGSDPDRLTTPPKPG